MRRPSEKARYATQLGKYLYVDFEPVNEEYVLVLNRIDGVNLTVIITDEVMLLLILHFEPFFREILAQLVRKAYIESKSQHVNKVTFSISAIKREVFHAHISGNPGTIAISVANRQQTENFRGVN